MTELKNAVPSLKESGVLSELSPWMDDQDQLLLLHDETDLEKWNGSEPANFVSCLARFDAPLEEVRQRIKEFERYPEHLEEVNEAEILENHSSETLVDFEFTIETPVYNPTFEYRLRYRETGDGDLIFEAVGGDFENVLGRWEFRENGDSTLVVYTVWYDMSNPGWTLSTIFWAQPDYRVALPVTRTAIELEQLRQGIIGEVNAPVDSEALPGEPDVPLFRKMNFPQENFQSLAEKGILLYVHPTQWINEGNNALDFRFVTAVGLMNQPVDRARELLTKFDQWPNFIDQIGSVESQKTSQGYEATWHLDLGVRFLPIDFQYTLEYNWKDDYCLPYGLTAGDLRYVYGALEWIPVEKDRTLYFYTMTTQIGERDSTLVKLGRLLPHFQIFVGVATGALAVRRMVDWINESP